MGRTVTEFWWSPVTEGTPALIVTAVFFAIGGLTGCFSALRTSDVGANAMSAYLDQFLTVAQVGGLETPAWGEFLWRSLRWQLGAVLCGFTALGLLAVPFLCSLRGFFLAFSVASFARSFGQSGLGLAFLLLGIPGCLTIPAFFVLSTQSLSASLALAIRTGGQGRRELPYGREYFLRCGVCATAVGFGLLAERYLVPHLVVSFAGVLLN